MSILFIIGTFRDIYLSVSGNKYASLLLYHGIQITDIVVYKLILQ